MKGYILISLILIASGCKSPSHITETTKIAGPGSEKTLSQYTKHSIDEIAYRLNYENTTYFIRTFREHTNMTPLCFRKQSNP